MDISSIDSMLDKYKGEVPGVAVLAIKEGEKVYNRQFGMANMEYRIPIKESTAFNIASITKQFTAMGIMILAERKELDYMDSIVRYLPELSHYCRNVALRHLLNNSSGIENYYRILERINRPSLGVTNEDTLRLLLNEKGLIFSPGEKFDYSNSNYVLLAIIIERLTGLTFGEFLKRNIFNPLGMKDSYIFDASQSIIPDRAYGYRVENGNISYNDYDTLTTGDGGIFSTLNDIYLWDQVLYTERLVSKGSMGIAFTPGRTNNGIKLEEDYGFGWSIGIHDGTRRLWHSGLDAGFRGLITRFPENRITIVLLSNNSSFSWGERLALTDMFYRLIK